MNADEITALLPWVFRRAVTPGSVVGDVVGVMSELHEPVERLLEDFGRFVDPYRCPPEFLPYLAHWVELGWLIGTDGGESASPAGERALRCTIAHAASLIAERGTRFGLRRFLTLATDLAGYQVESVPGFHIVVRAPSSAAPLADFIAHIVRHEKPAYVTADLIVGDEPPRRLGLSEAHQLPGGNHV